MADTSNKRAEGDQSGKVIFDFISILSPYDALARYLKRDSSYAGSDQTSLFARHELALCLGMPFVLMTFGVLSQYSGLDNWISGWFFDNAHHLWPLRNDWFFQVVLHDLVQITFKIIGGLILLYTLLQVFSRKGLRFPRAWLAAFLALMSGPMVVGYLKTVTHLPCPWATSAFGGTVTNLRLFDTLPPGMPIGHGFPSAHASSGFAFVALYFTACIFAPSRRLYVLAGAIILGLFFGVVQQARGAHFLSHDLFSLSICWLTAGGVYFAFYPRQLMQFFRNGPALHPNTSEASID